MPCFFKNDGVAFLKLIADKLADSTGSARLQPYETLHEGMRPNLRSHAFTITVCQMRQLYKPRSGQNCVLSEAIGYVSTFSVGGTNQLGYT